MSQEELDAEIFRVRRIISRNLADAMNVFGLTAVDLSLKTNKKVSRQHICKILKHQTTPSVEAMAHLSEALNVPLEYLLTDNTKIRKIPDELINSLPDDVREFCESAKSTPYIIVAKDIAENNITPEQFEKAKSLIIPIIKAIK